jgi:ribosomal protein L13E
MHGNQAVSNIHFCKDWKVRVHTWFKQPFRKMRRHATRVQKAKQVFPSTIVAFKPSVHCMTQRYNYKLRLGKGFTLKELQYARINPRLAKTVGISVDARRLNKSRECLMRNVRRLKGYMSRLVVLPMSQTEKAKRLVNAKANANKKAKHAAALKKYITERTKKLKDLKKQLNEAKLKYEKSKSLEDAKALKTIKVALKKEQIDFAKKAEKAHKKNVKATKQFNKLPVQYNKKDYKQVLDANRIVPMCCCHKPAVMKITKAMQKFDAVAKLRKEFNKARAVGGIKKGEAKKGDKAKK